MLSDWYSLSHIVHGFLFYAALQLARAELAGRVALRRRAAIEAWEIVENTPMVINRYREATTALGYTGDSVLNSLSDIAMMATRLPASRAGSLHGPRSRSCWCSSWSRCWSSATI